MLYLIRRWRFLSFYDISILEISSLSPRGDDRIDKHHTHGAGLPNWVSREYLSIIYQLFVKDELFF